ncbi:hypothetical protein PV325_013531 [Microctonus aethiopoides]|nr:hypothetical protein PV325_013531 [Microctonus aethiopoides]
MSRNGGMSEIGKRFRRLIDGHYSNRKIIIFLFFFCGFLLYFGPSFIQWLFSKDHGPVEAFEDHCMNERLANFHADAAAYDAAIIEYNGASEGEVINRYLPYVGNGILAVQTIPFNGRLFIKQGRTLSLDAQWDPLIAIIPDNNIQREATVMHFTHGIVYRYQCIKDGYHVTNQYYAHRIMDGIFVQDISISNPSSLSQKVTLQLSANQYWTDIKPANIQMDGIIHKYSITSGYVHLSDSNQIIVVSVVYAIPPKSVVIKPRSTTKLQFLTSVSYSNSPQTISQYANERKITEKNALKAIKKAISLQQQQQGIREQHVNIWQSYWHSGLSISESKAKDVLNGDKINSTIYYILSQIAQGIPDVEKSTSNNEGCYRGHHTLDAPRLWKDTSTIEGVNAIVKAWLITLEKQGCHRLITGGPSAVQQAIILSLGGLRFSNQHLEFNIDPQYLHRNYLFRRINYGNITHVNISVIVGEDNRAVLSVALDQSDSDYYGCDAGCLDSPVPLSQLYTNFPVKLTKPLTAILYITSDYQHMQDLRNALHVHEVEEAPAHDHHVMALHKHGHQLGGLPTFFWISICFLIIVFHMFLCKIIITEYCGHQDRQRTRYSKP